MPEHLHTASTSASTAELKTFDKPDEIRNFLDFFHLIIVRENHRVAGALQFENFFDEVDAEGRHNLR